MDDNMGLVRQTLIDLGAAFGLLTRLPMRLAPEKAVSRASASAWAYPVVGAALGALAGAVFLLLCAIGLPGGVAAATALAALVIASGAMHEDGLADCTDGFFGGTTPERRLEIMKDSRIGVYGALALIVVGLARWSAMSELGGSQAFLILVAVGAASRTPMVVAMNLIPPARRDGLSATVGATTLSSAIAAIAVAIVICVVCMGSAGIALLLVAAVGGVPIAVLGKRLIGGQTGDVLGGMQQCAEVSALAAAILLM